MNADASPAELWAEIYRLRSELEGPRGFATWKDAALYERLRVAELYRRLGPVAPPEAAALPHPSELDE